MMTLFLLILGYVCLSTVVIMYILGNLNIIPNFIVDNKMWKMCKIVMGIGTISFVISLVI